MSVLYAVSDLHLGSRENRELFARIPAHPADWVIVAGDVGETTSHLELACRVLCERFRRVIWVPGNHELWCLPGQPGGVGEARYSLLVELCRRYGVITPEDPFPLWEGEGGPALIAPMFLLYDYSFRPPEVTREGAVAWATESGVLAVDEELLRSDPHASIAAWCEARVAITERRLAEAAARHPLVLVNHFPLRADLVHIPAIPRFSIWCGTTRTNDWHTRFRARVVVYGHLHVRRTAWRDGVRFEEVSFGGAEYWQGSPSPDGYLREILPGPSRSGTG